jgi:hypothetical protein
MDGMMWCMGNEADDWHGTCSGSESQFMRSY